MVDIAWGMLALGLFGLLTSTVFLGMVLVGARRFWVEARRQEEALAAKLPENDPLQRSEPPAMDAVEYLFRFVALEGTDHTLSVSRKALYAPQKS